MPRIQRQMRLTPFKRAVFRSGSANSGTLTFQTGMPSPELRRSTIAEPLPIEPSCRGLLQGMGRLPGGSVSKTNELRKGLCVNFRLVGPEGGLDPPDVFLLCS